MDSDQASPTGDGKSPISNLLGRDLLAVSDQMFQYGREANSKNKKPQALSSVTQRALGLPPGNFSGLF
ncbi:hypothetical protein RRG08_039179 [Elysia crispata]|uniref:Uncharacterized protein n=1 Tax=Elysia crispata TaxID=231223 RepID=A0AAE0ZDB6_9GAST|nr:hypothetical protein RRG08_039179 [Elysia crispata]